MRVPARHAVIAGAQRLAGRLPPRWDRRVREVGKMAIAHHGRRISPLRTIEYTVQRRRSRYLVVPFGDGQLMVDSRDDEVGRTVFLTGGYERWQMETVLSMLAEDGRRVEGTVFVDAGANIGTSTVDALLRGGFGRAASFEPEPHNLRLLAANAALNGLADRVDIHPVALSDTDGTVLLQRSPTNFGDHRVVPGGSGPAGNGPGGDEKVECRQLDALVGEGRLDPEAVGLFWCDTQGHELKVLRGATTLAAAGVPHLIEFCPWVLGEEAPGLEDHLALTFSHIVDIHAGAPIRPADLPELRRKYQRHGFTDLLLIP